MSTLQKIITREQAASLERKALTVGYTSGVFDLLHSGHVEYLEDAKKLCDRLIVGINSDVSVKTNKGPTRPIQSQGERARVVAGLSAVDAVFIFSEKNNNINIEVLKPDFYIKAGDYSIEKLSSAGLVESYGGKVVLVSMKEGQSSSRIIEKIQHQSEATELAAPLPELRPAAFLDRDGTIIEHVEYIHEPSKVRILPGALEGMRKFKDAGYRLVMVTNQPGIGLGYFTKEDFFKVNREVLRACTAAGISIDKVYFCPHSEAEKCSCRKPGTAMIERAVSELNIDLSKSVMIGDMTLDIKLGKNARIPTIQVTTGLAGGDKRHSVEADYVVTSIDEGAETFIRHSKGK